MSQTTGNIRGVAFDAFGTLASALPAGTVLPWHDKLRAAKRRQVRSQWMRGEIGYEDLVTIGDTRQAPPPRVLEVQALKAAAVIQLLPGVVSLLDELQRRGYPMVCVSNLSPPIGPPLKRLLSPWINDFVFSYEIGLKKPHQQMFTQAAEYMGLPPHRVLMVGDSPRADIRGAQSVGMPSVLVDHRGAAVFDEVRKRLEL